MAEASVGARDLDTRKSLSWTELLKTFLIALDPFKLLIAALGILFTALGWWLISVVFYNSWTEFPVADEKERLEKRDISIRERSNALATKDNMDKNKADLRAASEYDAEYRRFELMHRMASRGGTYRTMPWMEDRGPNHFLLANEVIRGGAEQRAEVSRWFFSNQVPVLIEPLLKFFRPVLTLFDPNANFWVRLYLLFMIFWMMIIWALVGGVITRMTIVQIAGKEGGGLRDSMRFVMARYMSYLFSPLVPLLLILAAVIGCMVFGLFHMIPMFGDIVVDGLFWWIPLGAGFVMALLVVGLVGYPLMYATLSAEGSDTFDALSRSYNYVYESPWSYLWYALVAIVYGAVVIFFVVFMSSLMVYFGKWGVSQTPMPSGRQPDYLFIYSPTSFGWRELMLKGSPVEITTDKDKVRDLDRVREEGKSLQTLPAPGDKQFYVDPKAADDYMKDYAWYNYAGAGMVGFWMTLLFMLMLGFTYSYFWTAASMIYLLMRKRVDETEPDEIYTEEEAFEEPIAPPKLSSTSTPASPPPTSIPVDAPTLRMPPPVTPPTPPPVTPPTSPVTPPPPPVQELVPAVNPPEPMPEVSPPVPTPTAGPVEMPITDPSETAPSHTPPSHDGTS